MDSNEQLVNAVIKFVNEKQDQDIPKAFSLSQNFPNPFNPQTVIQYRLSECSKVILNVYNIHGRLVRKLVDDPRSHGIHSVTWDGKDDRGVSVSSGVYFYRMQAGEFLSTKRMTLIH